MCANSGQAAAGWRLPEGLPLRPRPPPCPMTCRCCRRRCRRRFRRRHVLRLCRFCGHHRRRPPSSPRPPPPRLRRFLLLLLVGARRRTRPRQARARRARRAGGRSRAQPRPLQHPPRAQARRSPRARARTVVAATDPSASAWGGGAAKGGGARGVARMRNRPAVRRRARALGRERRHHRPSHASPRRRATHERCARSAWHARARARVLGFAVACALTAPTRSREPTSNERSTSQTSAQAAAPVSAHQTASSTAVSAPHATLFASFMRTYAPKTDARAARDADARPPPSKPSTALHHAHGEPSAPSK